MLECAALILSPYDETLVSDLLVACYDSHTNLPSSYILRSTYNNTSHLTHSSPSHLDIFNSQVSDLDVIWFKSPDVLFTSPSYLSTGR